MSNKVELCGQRVLETWLEESKSQRWFPLGNGSSSSWEDHGLGEVVWSKICNDLTGVPHDLAVHMAQGAAIIVGKEDRMGCVPMGVFADLDELKPEVEL